MARPGPVAVRTPPGTGRRTPGRQSAHFVGPAFVAAVAYVDPGNFATNVTAGSRYGFALLWVVLVANAVAMLVQYLSAKLGIATGMNLSEMCRERYGRRLRIGLWVQAELVIMMTDLAEVVGGALALNMLFGVPLPVGGALTVAGMLLVLLFQQRGRRQFEAVITALLAVVLVAFVYQTFRAHIDGGAAVRGLAPSLPGRDSALLAVGIVGATVMPHAIYLHSALTQELVRPGRDSSAPGSDGRRSAGTGLAAARRAGVRMSALDVVAALSIAAVVNASILMAATSLHGSGADSLTDAYGAFGTIFGGFAATVFGIALLASGLAASCVGVYSGQIVMQGFLRRSVPIWQRRLVSLLPAAAVLCLGVDPTLALVLSQVVLSFGVPFALVPLLRFTGDPALMGELVNRRVTRVAAVVAAALIIAMNAYLIVMVVA
ncbi:Nramp family divalent metal transporter [Actinacidiphila alni]|uniref:Nramp family divalent metal transporter n=1 Tax=Actinacidiphila alni TaxID=380248 RepID=UPI0034572101